jgi:hypothetical protein
VLLEQRTPEQLAAVLVRVRREMLPAPEVLANPGADRQEAWSVKKRPGGDKRKWVGGGRHKAGGGHKAAGGFKRDKWRPQGKRPRH